MSTVVAVQTRGREYYGYWVTLFRLELSQDCVTFSPLLDVSGSNLVNDYLPITVLLLQRKYAMSFTQSKRNERKRKYKLQNSKYLNYFENNSLKHTYNIIKTSLLKIPIFLPFPQLKRTRAKHC